MALRLPHLAVLAQALFVVLAMGALALWPPRRGAMLLVPLSGREASSINAALTADARLLAAGPIAGSVVVYGDRASLSRLAWNRRFVILAAPTAWCAGPAVARRA